MFGSFLPSLWSSSNQSVLRSREPTLLCNQVASSFQDWLSTVEVGDEIKKVSSIWLQMIWLAVGSTVKTRDLAKLNNNSIPTAPTKPICFLRLAATLSNKTRLS